MDVLAETSALSQEDTAGRESSDNIEKTPEVIEQENKFQKAIASWRSIDLTNLVSKLDTTASDIVAHQRDSLVQRKDLAQKTKDFRKLDDAGKLGEYKGLLKAYQTFIDLLTNDGKAASSAFLQLYSSLSEAPDPYPLLEASVDSLLVSEDTIPKLTAENEHLQRSLSSLTTQLEQTEKRLDEERKTRIELEQNRDKDIKDVESAWSAALKEKTDNWEAKERSLEEKVENQDRLLKEIKASYEVSQRLGTEDGSANDASASSATAAELEIVSADLEKTSLRLADVEARNEQLRLELAQAASQRSDKSSLSLEENPAYQRLQSENSTLLRKLESARFDKEADRKALESKVKQVERSSVKTAAERDELRAKLDKFADYDDIKQELEVIKSIEFSTGDDDDTADADMALDESTNGDLHKGKKDSLEQLLLARNKKLGNELTILRVSHQDLQQQLESLKIELNKSNSELEKSQKLASTLENDLLTVQSEASNAFPSGASVAGTYVSRYPQSSRRGGNTSPTSSIISGFNPRETLGTRGTLDALRAGEAIGGGSGILPMVQAQRDRFKVKNAQLEDELSKAYTNISNLRSEVASLQKDNLNLYEKTRYVSTYNRNTPSGGTSSSSYSNRPTQSSILPITDTDNTSTRYKTAYEAQISPFAQFRGREAARAYRRMTLPERIVYSITRLVMATRMSRNLFAGYCVVLHLLVFYMLYWVGTVDYTQHASQLGAIAGAAAGVGGGSSGVGGGSAAAVGGDSSHGEWRQEGIDAAG